MAGRPTGGHDSPSKRGEIRFVLGILSKTWIIHRRLLIRLDNKRHKVEIEHSRIRTVAHKRKVILAEGGCWLASLGLSNKSRLCEESESESCWKHLPEKHSPHNLPLFESVRSRGSQMCEKKPSLQIYLLVYERKLSY